MFAKREYVVVLKALVDQGDKSIRHKALLDEIKRRRRNSMARTWIPFRPCTHFRKPIWTPTPSTWQRKEGKHLAR
jgi:hypothetical protein